MNTLPSISPTAQVPILGGPGGRLINPEQSESSDAATAGNGSGATASGYGNS